MLLVLGCFFIRLESYYFLITKFGYRTKFIYFCIVTNI